MDWSGIYQWLYAQVVGNEFFAGGMVMGVLAWIAVVAREWPMAIGMFLWRQFSTELTIRSVDGEAFTHAALWLAKHRCRKDARRLGLVDYWDSEEEDASGYEVTFGFGNHLIWEGLRPIYVSRSVQENAHTNNPVQTLTLRTVGRSQKPLLDIIARAKHFGTTNQKVPVLVWNSGEYSVVDRREPRPIESIVMPEGQRDGLVADLVAFAANKDWYRHRGIPWRRGYLLEGPPGTGKSSTIVALAGVLRKPIYIINPSAVFSDNDLLRAVSYARDGIVVMEDIDAIKLAEDRADEGRKRGGRGDAPGPRGVSLSGLLNAIDGVASREGRVLFITSNHPEKLDPALIRPGRVDVRVHLGLMDRDLGAAMFERFFTGECPKAFLDSVAWPQTPAAVQGLLLKWQTDKVVQMKESPDGERRAV